VIAIVMVVFCVGFGCVWELRESTFACGPFQGNGVLLRVFT
jgi:hypothetical protein